MENGGGAAATNTAEKHVAIPVAAATNGAGEEKMVNGGGEENKAEDLPAPALLPSGPRKTGLFIFFMNIRCVSLFLPLRAFILLFSSIGLASAES